MVSNVRETSSFTVWLHRILDTLTPILTLYITSGLYNQSWSDKYLVLGILGGLLLVFFNQGRGVYSHWRGRTLLAGFKLVIQGWIFTWLALLAIAFLFKDSSHFSRVIIVNWALLTPVFLFLYRLIVRSAFGYFRSKGWHQTNVAIIGAGELGQRLAKTLKDAKMLGYNPIGFYDDNQDLLHQNFHHVPILGSIDDLLQMEHKESIYSEIYITLPLRAQERITEVLNGLADSTVTVKFIPDCFAFDLLHSRMTDIGGVPIISVYDSPLNNLTNKTIKRIEDLILSVLILALISPIMLIVAIGIKLTSPGPVLYTQTRIGWNGKPFKIYKFRSMPVNTDEKGTEWGSAKDKTNTKFGQFIRKTSIDELPQFLNTLKGDMSIVGPRPERDVFVKQFRKEIPRYMQKHLVKAGITGWAQVNGWRGDTSLDKRIQFDLFYIDNWSLWFDIKIILLTIIKGFINKNAY